MERRETQLTGWQVVNCFGGWRYHLHWRLILSLPLRAAKKKNVTRIGGDPHKKSSGRTFASGSDESQWRRTLSDLLLIPFSLMSVATRWNFFFFSFWHRSVTDDCCLCYTSSCASATAPTSLRLRSLKLIHDRNTMTGRAALRPDVLLLNEKKKWSISWKYRPPSIQSNWIKASRTCQKWHLYKSRWCKFQ